MEMWKTFVPARKLQRSGKYLLLALLVCCALLAYLQFATTNDRDTIRKYPTAVCMCADSINSNFPNISKDTVRQGLNSLWLQSDTRICADADCPKQRYLHGPLRKPIRNCNPGGACTVPWDKFLADKVCRSCMM